MTRTIPDPSAPVLVVSDAAVEAATTAVRRERAFAAAAAFGVPLDSVPQCAEMIAYAALSAALPHLGAAPSVEHIARTLAETTALSGADAHLIVQAAQAMSAPSATREDVNFAIREFDGRALTNRQIAALADGLLARFTITPRTDR